MKVKCITALMSAFCMIFALTACGAENDKTPVEVESSIVSQATSFSVAQQIYSDDHLDLTCKEIRSDGIVFECNNKTPREVMLFLDISLDGKLQDMWCDGNECTIPAEETKEFVYNAEQSIVNTEHETISIAGMGFVDGTEYLSFDVVDFNIGGSRNPDELPTGERVYESDLLDAEFIGLFAQGLEFKISNKTDEALSFYVNEILINGDTDGYGCAFTMPAKSEGICQHYITNYIENFNGDDIKSFTASIKTNLPNEGTVELCKMEYDNGKITSTSVTKLENKKTEATTETESITETKGATTETTESKDERSNTQKAYDAASNMTKADLTGSKGKWKYHGLLLATEDCEWIDDSMNKDGTVEAGALYRKVDHLLQGFDMKLHNGKDYCEMIFGIPFESRDALVPYVENAKDLYKEKYPIISVMKKFNTLNSISGDYDFEYGSLGKYSLVIEDTSVCAKELMVSEEMLGYILAMLNEYDAKTTFDGNKCFIEYESYISKQ